MAGMFFEDTYYRPTNLFIVVLILVIYILMIMGTVFSGMSMKKAFEGYGGEGISNIIGGGATSGAGVRFASTMSGLGSKEGFLGRAEPPVFYQIGDTELVRSDRAYEKVDKPEGFDIATGQEWAKSRKAEAFDPAKALAGL